jgi:hypothetical protein
VSLRLQFELEGIRPLRLGADAAVGRVSVLNGKGLRKVRASVWAVGS